MLSAHSLTAARAPHQSWDAGSRSRHYHLPAHALPMSIICTGKVQICRICACQIMLYPLISAYPVGLFPALLDKGWGLPFDKQSRRLSTSAALVAIETHRSPRLNGRQANALRPLKSCHRRRSPIWGAVQWRQLLPSFQDSHRFGPCTSCLPILLCHQESNPPRH